MCYIPKVDKCYVEFCMLTNWMVPSLTCKCVFYRLENNAVGRPHGTGF